MPPTKLEQRRFSNGAAALGSMAIVTACLKSHRDARRHPRYRGVLLGAAVALAGWGGGFGKAWTAEVHHAIAMHGEPALPEGFDKLRYADPAAPKGGRLVQGVLGTFDSLNPLIVKGIALPSIRGYVIESLMARGYDEPFTLYGLVARAVETDAARSYVTFTLNPAARFSD